MKRILVLLAITAVSFCSCKKYTCHCVNINNTSSVMDKKIKAKSDSDAGTQCALYNVDHLDYACEVQK